MAPQKMVSGDNMDEKVQMTFVKYSCPSFNLICL